MSSLVKEGDHVIASRKAHGSDVLSSVMHHAKVLSIGRPNRHGNQTITLEYRDDLAGYPRMDTIKFFPEGHTEVAATVVKAVDGEDSDDTTAGVESSQSAAEVSFATAEAATATSVMSSQSSVASVISSQSSVASTQLPATQVYTAPGHAWLPEYSCRIPDDFDKFDARSLLRCAIPDHIKARWAQINKQLLVGELFATNTSANAALQGVQLKLLGPLCGTVENSEVASKSHKKADGELGLVEVFEKFKIAGRTQRARRKGLMFFFLMTAHPDNVVFPPFGIKRKRASPYSLAEVGRLVGLLSDSANVTLVSMLYKKWTRTELDAKTGEKGIAHFWTLLSNKFNDRSYLPPACAEFADHIISCGSPSVYTTALVPEYRCGDSLRDKWGTLRANYGLFLQKYNKSGHNEPDATKYSKDLLVLLMHYVFTGHPLEQWASKTIGDGAVDDVGDGCVPSTAAKHRSKKSKVTFGADSVIAASNLYETIHNLNTDNMDDEDKEKHMVRLNRVTAIVDKFLDKFEDDM